MSPLVECTGRIPVRSLTLGSGADETAVRRRDLWRTHRDDDLWTAGGAASGQRARVTVIVELVHDEASEVISRFSAESILSRQRSFTATNSRR